MCVVYYTALFVGNWHEALHICGMNREREKGHNFLSEEAKPLHFFHENVRKRAREEWQVAWTESGKASWKTRRSRDQNWYCAAQTEKKAVGWGGKNEPHIGLALIHSQVHTVAISWPSDAAVIKGNQKGKKCHCSTFLKPSSTYLLMRLIFVTHFQFHIGDKSGILIGTW